MTDIIIILIILVLAAFAVRCIIKRKGKCCGDCNRCHTDCNEKNNR